MSRLPPVTLARPTLVNLALFAAAARELASRDGHAQRLIEPEVAFTKLQARVRATRLPDQVRSGRERLGE